MLYLLDTNALSEINKPRPNPGFLNWFERSISTELYLSCITVGELYKRIALVAEESKRKQLEQHIKSIVSAFNARILAIDTDTTLIWAELLAGSIKKGQTAPSIDALIAAQCLQRKLVLVTPNVKDYENFTGLEILCPWIM